MTEAYSSFHNRLPVLYKGLMEEGTLVWGNKDNIVIDAIKRSLDGKGIVSGFTKE